MEHSLAFVQPKLGEHFGVHDRLGLGHQDALEHLRDISHVEQIMEARRDGKHILVELGEHVNCCCHGNVSTFSYWVREMICRKEVADDRFEDVGQDFL